MALGATIYKASLQIADMDRNHYADYQLTLARHPSETDERMMVRLLSFALHADDQLTFTRGLCVDEEPDLWRKSLSDEIELWIDVGLPDERRVRKACNRSHRVCLYTYGGRGVELWWQRNTDKLQRFDNLRVYQLTEEDCRKLTALARRGMQLQVTIQDGSLWLSDGEQSSEIRPHLLFGSEPG